MIGGMVMRTVLCAFSTALLLTGCAGITSQTNSYATLAEARQAGAIANGWIPDGLPTASHDIREGHIPGTSRHWGIFEYPHAEEEILRVLLEPQETAAEDLQCDIPARIEWWPLILRGPLDRRRLAATGTRLYLAKSGGLLFAVNWRQGRAYYWTM